MDKRLEAKGVLRNLFEEDGLLLASLPQYAGIFSLSLKNKALCAAIRDAYAQKREVKLTCDWDFKILKVE